MGGLQLGVTPPWVRATVDAAWLCVLSFFNGLFEKLRKTQQTSFQDSFVGHIDNLALSEVKPVNTFGDGPRSHFSLDAHKVLYITTTSSRIP